MYHLLLTLAVVCRHKWMPSWHRTATAVRRPTTPKNEQNIYRMCVCVCINIDIKSHRCKTLWILMRGSGFWHVSSFKSRTFKLTTLFGNIFFLHVFLGRFASEDACHEHCENVLQNTLIFHMWKYTCMIACALCGLMCDADGSGSGSDMLSETGKSVYTI